jgi:hypothetical protein
MENTNDDGVAKVDLSQAQPAPAAETVHKVNLGAPVSTDDNDQTKGDEAKNQADDPDLSKGGGDAAPDGATNGDNTSGSDSADQPANNTGTPGDSGDGQDDTGADATGILEEITDADEDENKTISSADASTTAGQTDVPAPILPENIEKLVDFVNETGGTIEDYVKLNVDVDSLGEEELLREYHASLEPSLDKEEIDLIMEDLYDVDEDEMTDRELKRKSIDKKRDLAKAKKHMQSQKDKYYDEIKAGSSLTPDQKKAVDFFSRHNEAQEADQKSRTQKQQIFTEKTNEVFNEEFKGFEFKVGEKRFRYNVKDAEGTKIAQSDIENFTKKYLGDDNSLKDGKGYHKALFTAMNADAIADHFYKQGQADAIKSSAASKKNIDMGGRKSHPKAAPATDGVRARVVAVDKGTSPGKLRFKTYQ